MKAIYTLLKPRLRSFRSQDYAKNHRKGLVKFFLFGTLGVLFWGGIFTASLRVLFYFKQIEELGEIMAYKLMSMVMLTFLSLLIFSSILTSLSKLFLSRDLPLVHSMPVPSYKIFIARWIESTFDSSWMVNVYTLPVFLAYGIVFHAGLLFYVNVFQALFFLSVIASAVSTLLVMTTVMAIPAGRIKNIFVFFALSFFLIFFFAIRFLRPERLVNPDVFATTLIYLKELRTPAPAYLPSTWAFDSIKAALSGDIASAFFNMALSWTFAAAIVCIIVIVADAIYFKGVSKTQTSSMRFLKRKRSGFRFIGFIQGPSRALIAKEIKTFFRDQTQWSQLFLIGALIVIYLYNFKALPIEKAPIRTLYLQNLLSFLNMGLGTFVLTAITARFAYPAVSLEREAFWLIKSSPIPLKTFLWIKFWIYFIPLLLLTEILIISTNSLLSVTPFMKIFSTLTVFFIVPGIVSMGIGFGAAYPDFKSENAAQTVTSFGGVIFMMLCAGYIGAVIMLEAGPVYHIFMADIRNESLNGFQWAWTISSFSLAFAICVLAFLMPMRFGEKRLSNLLL